MGKNILPSYDVAIVADFGHGMFRVRGDTVDIYPATGESAYRIEMFGDDLRYPSRHRGLTSRLLDVTRNIIRYAYRDALD